MKISLLSVRQAEEQGTFSVSLSIDSVERVFTATVGPAHPGDSNVVLIESRELEREFLGAPRVLVKVMETVGKVYDGEPVEFPIDLEALYPQ